MALCQPCAKLGTLRWGPKTEPLRASMGAVERRRPTYELNPVVDHYPSLQEMNLSSRKCPLCSLFLTLFIAANGRRAFLDILQDEVASYKIRITRSVRDDFRSRWLSVTRLNKYKIWESYPVLICLENDPLSDRTIWKSSNRFSFDQSLPVLKAWLQSCEQDHGLCVNTAGFFPKRLIGINCGVDQDQPKLLPGSEARQNGGRYIALSHCWGNGEEILKTTSRDLPNYQIQIPVDKIPKTYRDAMIIARALDVSYLWIDSLCIVQDDDADWHSQSAEMASVYQNSYLTIAAADSINPNGGFLRSHTPSLKFEFQGTVSRVDPPVVTEPKVKSSLIIGTRKAVYPEKPTGAVKPKMKTPRAGLGKVPWDGEGVCLTIDSQAHYRSNSLSPATRSYRLTPEKGEDGEKFTSLAPKTKTTVSRAQSPSNESSSITSRTGYTRGCVRKLPLLEELVTRSPLHKRGWTLQETVLSMRIIYFTNDQIIWHCRNGFRSEDGYIGAQFPRHQLTEFKTSPELNRYDGEIDPRNNETSGQESWHRLQSDPWWDWVEDYSRRELTFLKDKYAAFAGITDFYQMSRSETIILGLRKKALSVDLMWIPQGPAVKSKLPDVPSWSWFSITRPVKRFTLHPGSGPSAWPLWDEAEILDYAVNWSGLPLTSWSSGCSITLEGKISQAEVYPEAYPWSSWGGDRQDYYRFQPLLQATGSKSRACDGRCIFDAEQPPPGTVVHCLMISEERNESFTYSWAVLVLTPTGASDDEFRRIGVGVVEDSYVPPSSSSQLEFFSEVSKRRITLV